MAATIAIVAAGVEHGIERACTWLMPTFLILLLLLAGHGLTLEGAGRAISFLFTPDWAALRQPQTYLAALGQALFSIGLGMGVVITYGAYVPQGERLPRAALFLVAGDTVVALLAGVMFFPAVFSHGIDPAHGPALAFAVLPEVFAAMPAGRWLAIALFLLLAIAALTSTVALLEVPVAWAMARRHWSRRRAALIVGSGALAAGAPVSLGNGVLAPAAGSAALLERVDHLASNILLPASAIAIALLVGWACRGGAARQAADLEGRLAGPEWRWGLRIALPLVIALVMARGLGW
ncbi:MAG: sodium-dependent transporter [Burkholderiales bacterium]|nr:sodium-dependent transporter [Burkholderiales bacterium]